MSTPAEDAATAGEALVSGLTAPKRVKTDNVEVEGRSIDELIKADRHLAGKAAARSATRGLRFTKLIPPGTD